MSHKYFRLEECKCPIEYLLEDDEHSKEVYCCDCYECDNSLKKEHDRHRSRANFSPCKQDHLLCSNFLTSIVDKMNK